MWKKIFSGIKKVFDWLWPVLTGLAIGVGVAFILNSGLAFLVGEPALMSLIWGINLLLVGGSVAVWKWGVKVAGQIAGFASLVWLVPQLLIFGSVWMVIGIWTAIFGTPLYLAIPGGIMIALLGIGIFGGGLYLFSWVCDLCLKGHSKDPQKEFKTPKLIVVPEPA